MGLVSTRQVSANEVVARLAFFKNLQSVTTRIHATQDIDEIILELSGAVCELFGAERLTIYTMDESRKSINAKVKTGLAISTLRLPVSPASIAGYVAQTRRTLNIRNVYDRSELSGFSPEIQFRKDIDEHSGYRSREMLVSPIIDPEKDELLGVIQLINSVDGKAFTAFAEEGLQGLAQTLGVAFAQRSRPNAFLRSRYDQLVEESRITAEELQAATTKAREKGVSLETVLIDEFSIEPSAIGQALSRFYRVPYEPFKSDRIKPVDLLRNFKREYVDQNRWLPLEEGAEGIVILAVDPEQVRASRIAQNVFPKSRIAFRVTTQGEFNRTTEQYFGISLDAGSVDDLLSDLTDVDQEGTSVAEDVSAAADNELVKLVNKIILDAHRQGASDIHIEPRPGKEKTQIRFRKDGSLIPYIEVPASYRNPLITRIKIMCDLDISERRRPQDGKIKFRKYAPLDLELRVATVPTAGGMEDVVMRLLGNSEPLPLEDLGLLPFNLKMLKDTVAKPYGLFFVCGPTGSGKTTTLHSILAHINTPDTKIWTAEDPVEITQRGLRQVQVNRKAGLDFAAMMRAFLRADPDVIMVGEMRDKETVSIGIEASLTGHLVFSTLHTNSAAESIVRLLDMGMDPFNFADALVGVLAQRLAKRLCLKCRKARFATDEELHDLVNDYCEDLKLTPNFKVDPEAARREMLQYWRTHHGDGKGNVTLYDPVGCQECNGGYRGRLGLHELMVGSNEVKRLIQIRARVPELVVQAMEEGMRTLRQDGIKKVLAGLTDMNQVRRVCIR
ncbi:MAG: Flp pilus assembly complex ATPase component TadA [Zoogloeaceae bacterium]|nr:Flp pilus assembly complex ATPase component TadA [Zoogloeaceae bacterium]